MGIAVIGLWGCSENKPLPELPAIPVVTAQATQEDIPDLLSVFGTVAAINTVTIIPQVTGTLKQTHFNYGDFVNKDDLLFTIDDRPFVAALIQAEADMRAKIAAAKVAEDKAKRNAPLLTKNYISYQEYEQLLAQADEARQAVVMAEAKVLLAKINLDYTQIKAPFTGLTGVKLFSNGELVEANKTKILTINQIDPIQVNFSIPSTEFSRVQRAFNQQNGRLPMSVSIIESPDTDPIQGQTSFFDNSISSQTGTLELQGILPNTDQRLWVGQYVSVSLKLGTLQQAVLVPQSAVAIGPQGPYVFVIDSSQKAEFRLVKQGNTLNDRVVIEQGVQPGEKVVVSGQIKLKPGVIVQEAAPLALKPSSSL